VVSQSGHPSAPRTAEFIFRLGPVTDRYRINTEDRFRCREATPIDASGSWTVTSRDGDCFSNGQLRRTVHLVRLADGSIAMNRLDDHEHDRAATFDPPLILYPALLAPGDVHTHASDLASGKLDGSGTKSGTATCETRFLNDGRLQMALVLRLSPAVVRRTTQWTLDPSGQILQEDDRRTLHVGPLRLENEHVVLTFDPVR